MFEKLKEINSRPAPFSHYTADELWADEHISKKMLAFHLNSSVDISSRNGRFIDESTRWIISHFSLGQGKSVADFGCGPGLYSSRLAACGADVTGIDFSARSIEYARDQAKKQNFSVNYVHTDYLQYETDDQFDLIIMIMCDFCALSPTQRRQLLEKFYKLLRPGGAVLCDVYSYRAFDKREEALSYAPDFMDGFWAPPPYFGFVNTFKYEEEKVVCDKYTIIEEARCRVIYNWLQYFDCDTLKSEFETRGFHVDRFPGDVAGAAFDPDSDEFAVIAKKPLFE